MIHYLEKSPSNHNEKWGNMYVSAENLVERFADKIIAFHNSPERLKRYLRANLTRRKKSPAARAIASGNIFVMRRSAYYKVKSLIGDKRFEEMRRRICDEDEYDYCRRGMSKKIVEVIFETILGAAAAGMIAAPVTSTVVGLAFAITFILNHDQLHKLCDCDKKYG